MADLQPDKGEGPDVPPVDLRRLRYFLAVCEHGGISRAAAALGMAQPALSRHIQLLEKEIGMPLFKRSGKGTEPSAQGRHLLAAARDQLRLLDDAVRGVRERFAAPAAHVRLGVCPTIAPLFVDVVTARVREHQPTLVLSVLKAYSDDIQNLLRQHQLDLALTYSCGSMPGFASTDLFAERLVLVLGRGHAESGRRSCALAEIAAMRLILPSRGHALRRIVDDLGERRGIPLCPDLELDSLETVRSLLAEPASQFCTILPVNSASLGLVDDCFPIREIDDPDMYRTIALVRPAASRPEDAVDLVAEQVLERAAELALAT